jgi:hypothetical protein
LQDEHILLVDDEKGILTMLELLLTGFPVLLLLVGLILYGVRTR